MAQESLGRARKQIDDAAEAIRFFSQARASLLILGTFHFAGSGLDALSTHAFDVDARAAEIDDTDPRNRDVLIIGHGHVSILRHAALASPEVELVEASEILG